MGEVPTRRREGRREGRGERGNGAEGDIYLD